ncbi:MAG TPA: carbohydrate ABC transporter permease [Acidimicrobiia bacterium]|nr:carbohydrate ABC transporter permease [Acidimicrobiia bacterium]
MSAATTSAGREPVASRMVGILTRGPIYVFMTLVALFWLLPTIGLFFLSLRSPADNAASGWWTALMAPSQLTFENYRELFSEGSNIPESLWNTALITVPTTLILTLIAAMAAFAFAFVRFKGRDVLFIVVVALLVVPLQVALIPIAELYGEIGIGGSLVSVILFHVAFGLPFAIFLLRNFFVGIPTELLEAARMDGASELRIFLRVVLPLGYPAMAALAIFQFLWVWNDLLVALIFADPGNAPITVAIQQQTRAFGASIDVIAPGAFVSLLIPLIVFFGFQRYFVQGLLAGSQK